MKFPNPFKAIAAAWRVFRYLWDVSDKTPSLMVAEDEFETRRGICRWECDQFDRSSGQCKKCTCFVDVKARFVTEKCPLDKWPK